MIYLAWYWTKTKMVSHPPHMMLEREQLGRDGTGLYSGRPLTRRACGPHAFSICLVLLLFLFLLSGTDVLDRRSDWVSFLTTIALCRGLDLCCPVPSGPMTSYYL